MSLHDLVKEAEKGEQPSPARIFLEFKYGEIRDLLKHFLTLISGSLVFSVAFSDKIIDYDAASRLTTGLAIAAWVSLVLALGACGYGIYTLYIAAEQAMHALISKNQHYQVAERRSYFFQDTAGLLFGLGLVLLVVAAAIK